MSAPELERALGALGIRGRIEARDGLAVLVAPDALAPLADAALRRRAAAVAREHGFTHLALELPDEGEGGANAEDAARRAPLHRG